MILIGRFFKSIKHKLVIIHCCYHLTIHFSPTFFYTILPILPDVWNWRSFYGRFVVIVVDVWVIRSGETTLAPTFLLSTHQDSLGGKLAKCKINSFPYSFSPNQQKTTNVCPKRGLANQKAEFVGSSQIFSLQKTIEVITRD